MIIIQELQYLILYGGLQKFNEIDLPIGEFEPQFQNNLCTEHYVILSFE